MAARIESPFGDARFPSVDSIDGAFGRLPFLRSLFGLAFCLCVLAGAASQATAGPMSIPGQSSVDNQGQFSYNIPIVVPPGTAGMAPALSLAYSSANGDGFEGIGWTLNGLPSITRCPRTQTLDSIHGGVNYNSDDRFCLNGQRLMLTGGTYGADGSTYGTYIDGMANVVLHCASPCANGPDWFEVQLKDGTVLQLGHTTDSYVQAVGTAIARAWMINRRTDVKGNYFTVTYTESQGQAYPTRIDYTARDTSPVLAAYNSVQFIYRSGTRPDVMPAYKAGSLQEYTKLLSDIETFVGATMVLDYKLGYRLGTTTTHSRLTSLTLYDGAGNNLAPMTFTWQGGTGTLTPTGTAQTLSAGAKLSAGDFTGDGLTDVMAFSWSCSPSGGGIVWKGTSSGGFTAGNLTATYTYKPNNYTDPLNYSGALCFPGEQYADGAAIVDLNADGKSDLLLSQTRYRWNGVDHIFEPQSVVDPLPNDGHGNQNELPTGWLYTQAPLLGDFNGDGYSDFFDGTAANFGAGDGTFTVDTARSAPSGVLAADFDGDGCTDILQQGAANNIVYYCNPAYAIRNVSIAAGTIIPGDFNGDGIADVLVVDSSGGGTIYLGTGKGFSAAHVVSTTLSGKVVAGDWDGDGKTDIALLSQTAGSPHLIFLSTGTDFVQVATIADSTTEPVTGAVADWNSDGPDDLWIQKASGDVEYVFNGSAYPPELMTGVNNGLSATNAVAITYNRINKNGTFYTKGTSSVYPYQDLDGAYFAVSQVSYNNGVGSTYHTSYAYNGAIVDVTAPPTPGPKWNMATVGLVTFTKITATDSRTGLVSQTNFRTDLPYTGLIATINTTNGAGGQLVKSVSNVWANQTRGGSNGIQLTTRSDYNYDLNGALISSLSTHITSYDTYNNPLGIQLTRSDGSTRTITNTFNNETSPWILGQQTASTVRGVLGTSDITRTFSFTPDPATGFVTTQIAEPSSSTMKLETDYQYDSYGNLKSVMQSGSGLTTRTTSAQYDSNGQFPATVTDALTRVTQFTYDPNFGGQTSVTDPNPIQTSLSYDTFGRPSLVTKPDTNEVSTTYAYCSGINGGSTWCPAYGAYLVTTTPENSSGTQNGVMTRTYYDALDRVIVAAAEGFDGPSTSCTAASPCWIQTNTIYDGNGHVQKTSRPFFSAGGTAVYTTYTYDALDRVTLAAFPDTSTTTYCYNGMTTSTTDDKGHIKIIIRNAEGLPATVLEDASGDCTTTSPTGHNTNFTYDAFGNTLTTKDYFNYTITNTFDTRGRQTDMVDPDRGHWTFGYDALNELTSQTDAKLNNTTMTYDKLMRPTFRTEADLTSKWVWDTRPNGIGRPATACVNTTTCSASPNFWQQPNYDAYGRPIKDQQKIDGTFYSYNIAYTPDGRIDTITYPSGFVAKYVYTALGYLSQIKDGATGPVIWAANTRDAELHLTQTTAANGVLTTRLFFPNTGLLHQVQAGTAADPTKIGTWTYDYDTVGNLIDRSDTFEGWTENICYDGLYRLFGVAFNAACNTGGTTTTRFAANGSLIQKTDICPTAGCISHGGAGFGEHQLSQITGGSYNGVSNPNDFTYDANGNMTGGAGRTMAYMSFNRVSSMSNGGNALALAYGPWHERYKMCVPACTGTPTATTTYFADTVTGSYSEMVVSGGTTTWRDYIVADGQIVAMRSKTGSTVATIYMVNDHLGSPSAITDVNGASAVAERDSFDAWGRRRNPDGTPDPACALTSLTNRGYTGQEMLDSQCLINMNARIYDPTLAIFQSADSIIADPLSGQTYNRYGYVIGNPFRYTDPSGYALDPPPPPPSCYNGGWNCTTGTLLPNPDGSINVQTGDWLGFDSGGTSPGGWGGGGSLGTWNSTIYTQNGYTLYTAVPDPSGSAQIETVLATYWYEPAFTATNFGITNSLSGRSNGFARQGGAILAGAAGAGLIVGGTVCVVLEPCGLAAAGAGGVALLGGVISGTSARFGGGVTNPGGLAAASLVGGLFSGASGGISNAAELSGGFAVGLGAGFNAAGGFTGDVAAQWVGGVPIGNVDYSSAGVSGFMSAVGYFGGGSFAVDMAGLPAWSAAGIVTSVDAGILSTGGSAAYTYRPH